MRTMVAGVFRGSSGSGSTGRLGNGSNVDAVRRIGTETEPTLAEFKHAGRAGSDHSEMSAVLHAQVSHARDPKRIADNIGDFSILITLEAL
jgi:hypothetical protein